MKFSSTLTTLVCSALVFAAPTPSNSSDAESTPSKVPEALFPIPEEAVIAATPISNELVPVIIENNGQRFVVIVNGTKAEELLSSHGSQNFKREAEAWHWLSKGTFQPIKREADAEAKWHWLSKGTFQPIKREAAAWHWLSKGTFQPIKREADAEAKWHWLSKGTFQPIKREAEAWHWLSKGTFQPI